MEEQLYKLKRLKSLKDTINNNKILKKIINETDFSDLNRLTRIKNKIKIDKINAMPDDKREKAVAKYF